MGRVINPETAGKDRSRLSKSIVIALRELTKQNEVTLNTRDITAYIALALLEISSTIDKTVTPWEKRGYWVKADRFRMEWAWSDTCGNKLLDALKEEDWHTVAVTTATVTEKLAKVNVSERHRLGAPWVGAWKKWNAEEA